MDHGKDLAFTKGQSDDLGLNNNINVQRRRFPTAFKHKQERQVMKVNNKRRPNAFHRKIEGEHLYNNPLF